MNVFDFALHQKNCLLKITLKTIYFAVYGFYKFGDHCSYIHKTDSKQTKENDKDDIKSLKAEIETIKRKFNTIDAMKQEGKVLTKNVADLKEEIDSLRESNLNTAYRIRLLEEDFENVSENDDEENENNDEETLINESVTNNNLETSKEGGFEETDFTDDDEESSNDSSDEEKSEIKSLSITSIQSITKDDLDETNVKEVDEITLKDNNTREGNHDAIDKNSSKDIIYLNTVNEDKENVVVKYYNEKGTADWDALDEKYGAIEVGVMLDLDTLYQEYVLKE